MLILKEDLFYKPAFKQLYNLIKKLYEAEQCFDAVTLLGMAMDEDIQKTVDYAIVGNFFSGNLLDHHIEELHIFCNMRQKLHILQLGQKNCLADPVLATSNEVLSKAIYEASEVGISKQALGMSFAEIYQAFLENQYTSQSEVMCGIRQFETVKNSGLITIAGGSGVGKTYFSIYVMDQIARYQTEKQILFYSLEMKCNEIWERYLTIRHDKPIDLITDRTTPLPDGKVFDQPRIDIEFIETISRLESMKKPISVIVVDYLSLVTSKKKFEREDLRISDITQRLAALAMDLNCIVICLSQINRDSSKRTKDDRCPYPADVADSVGSVRSSSLWIGIDRPEIYDSAPINKNLFIAKCRKSRYGNQFEAWFDFNEGRFKERGKPFDNTKSYGGFDDLMGDFEE
jgi:replicative DNA helicase